MSTAMRLHEPGPLTTNRLTRDKVELPPLAPHEVRIEVAACAVCRTDLQLVAGDLPARTLPITPGHQIVGTITAIGSVVQADRLGNLVGVAWLAGSCGKCRFCLSGRENLCEFATFTGWDRDGGYATEVVANSDCAFDLPMDFLPAPWHLCSAVESSATAPSPSRGSVLIPVASDSACTGMALPQRSSSKSLDSGTSRCPSSPVHRLKHVEHSTPVRAGRALTTIRRRTRSMRPLRSHQQETSSCLHSKPWTVVARSPSMPSTWIEFPSWTMTIFGGNDQSNPSPT